MNQQGESFTPAEGEGEVEEIRQNIERTHEDLGETLQAIQEKLSPATLIEEARGPVEDTTDHIVTEVQRAVRESVDHILAQAQGPMKELGEELISRASTAAQETTDHVLEQARAAVTEATADIVAQTRHAVREATIGKVEQMTTRITQTTIDVADGANETSRGFGLAVMTTVRTNPLPTALAALGLGWLYLKRPKTAAGSMTPTSFSSRRPAGAASGGISSGATSLRDAAGSTAGAVGDTVSDAASAAGDTVRTAADTLGSAVGSAATTVGGTASAVGDTVGGAAGAVGGAVGDAVGTVEGAVGQVATRAQSATSDLVTEVQFQALRVGEGFQTLAQQNPLALGAAGLALGSLIGLVFPETPLENQVMGGARDAVLDQAGATAQDALTKVGEVASKVGQAASEAGEAAMQAAGS